MFIMQFALALDQGLILFDVLILISKPLHAHVYLYLFSHSEKIYLAVTGHGADARHAIALSIKVKRPQVKTLAYFASARHAAHTLPSTVLALVYIPKAP